MGATINERDDVVDLGGWLGATTFDAWLTKRVAPDLVVAYPAPPRIVASLCCGSSRIHVALVVPCRVGCTPPTLDLGCTTWFGTVAHRTEKIPKAALSGQALCGIDLADVSRVRRSWLARWEQSGDAVGDAFEVSAAAYVGVVSQCPQ